MMVNVVIRLWERKNCEVNEQSRVNAILVNVVSIIVFENSCEKLRRNANFKLKITNEKFDLIIDRDKKNRIYKYYIVD